jgi:diguanylate cyclase (GGDEF)-like protein/PAS domain S-box-containing protein
VKTVARIMTTAYSRRMLAERVFRWEENFRNLFDTVDDIIVVADTQARIVFANEGAIRHLGYPPAEYLGRSVLDFVPPDKREEVGQVVAAMLRKELEEWTGDIWTRQGGRIPVHIRVRFGQWDGQERVFVVGKDLSAEQVERVKFEGLFRHNPAAMSIHSTDDGRCIDANDAYLAAFGYTRDEVVGKPGLERELFVDDFERWSMAKEELLRTGALRNRELTIRRKDGRRVHGLLSGDLIDIQGKACALTVMVDITDELELQHALASERNRLANVIEGTRLGTWEWNLLTGKTTYNERWAEILGYTLAELEPTSTDTWVRLTHPEDVPESDRLVREHVEGRTPFYDFEGRMLHKNGDWVWVHDRGKVIERDPDGRALIMYGTHTDVTERRAMEEQIRELSIRDPLTGVYNRRYVFERLSEIVAEYTRYGRTFCVAIMDLDHFKAINDAYGHQMGDLVLREFAHAVGSTIRKNDLLGRYGGEEFIIVSSVGWPEIATLIERLMGTVRGRVFTFEGREVRFTFSCGLADSSEFSRDACSIEAMISRADERLYAAKAAGRDRFVGPLAGRGPTGP